MSLLSSVSSVFSWSRDKSSTDNKTKRETRRPATRYNADDMVANSGLVDQLYHNTYPGLKLAGGLAYNVIATPVWTMGLPIARPVDDEDEATRDRLKQIYSAMSLAMVQNHTICHRRGTSWIWPQYDSRNMRLLWRNIPDDEITDIIRDPVTDEITELYTDRQFTVATGRINRQTVRETRHYTYTRIITEYQGADGTGYRNSSVRNPVGILPINFLNNADPNDARGHSDYERVIQLLKQYHDIDLAESETLAKFRGKLVQTIANVDDWKLNNGISSFADFDPAAEDFILNITYADSEEKTEYIFPTSAVEGYELALKRIFRKLVETSGIPEIAWGLKTEGNNASVEESMGVLVSYAKTKQDEKTEKYKQLFEASLRLLAAVDMDQSATSRVVVSWDDLSAVNEQTKALIFQQYANGIAAVMNVAAITKEQLHAMWLVRFPKGTEQDFEVFNRQLLKAASFKTFRDASYAEIQGSNGGDPDLEGAF